MAVGVNGSGNWEVVFMQELHEEELSYGTQARQVEPVVACPVLNVLSIFLYASE